MAFSIGAARMIVLCAACVYGFAREARAQGKVGLPNRTVPSRADAALQRSRTFVTDRVAGQAAGLTPAALLMRARAEHAAMVRAQSLQGQDAGMSAPWRAVGPAQVDTSAWNLVTGRITSLAADPADGSGNTLYVGTTGGGVWKSTHAAGSPAGAAFAPLTDNLNAFTSASLASLSIGAISVQPNGTGIILAGTGDPNDVTDSWYGVGVLRSTDGGNTWSLIPASASDSGPQRTAHDFSGTAFAGFAWSTTTPNLVVAAVSRSEYAAQLGIGSPSMVLGLYYSQDAGATWQLATIEDGATVIQSPQIPVLLGNAATAVVWNPIRGRFYAAVRRHGYYESADGITWTRLDHQPGANLTTTMCPPNTGATGSSACPIFRGALAAQPLTGDLFAFTVDQNTLDQGIWQDACQLNSSGQCANGTVGFGSRITDTALESLAGDGRIAGGLYNLWLAAVPFQQDTLLFAGTTDIWRCSLANSCAWRNTTNTQGCAAAQVAPAQHAVETTFGAQGLLYFGNDGGLWRSSDAVAQQQPSCSPDDAAHFQNLNASMGSLAEVSGFSDDPYDPATWLVALGGLGTAATSGAPGAWSQVLDGEGDATAIDPLNPQNWYATSELGVGINHCPDGSSCSIESFGPIVIGPQQVDNDVQLIAAPWVLDPQSPETLILGTCRIWRGAASGAGWTDNNLLSGMLDGNQGTFCNGNAEVRALAVASVTSTLLSGTPEEQLYAGMAGPLDGGGSKPGHVYGARIDSNSQESSTKWTDLYYSPVTNGGAAGTQFNPNGFDIASIYVDPHDSSAQTVYVTIQGVSLALSNQPLIYRSTDGGGHWMDITANLPRAPANGITVDPNDANVVYVALDTGVYVTNTVANCFTSDAACWNVFGTGLPNAPAMAIQAYTLGLNQLLRVSTYGRGLWETDLLTAGLVRSTATVSPASLTYADQQAQTVSASQTVTVANTGNSVLKITAIQAPTDFVETDNCVGQAIAAGGSCQISVAFAPSGAGLLQESLTLYANIAGGQIQVSLAGKALLPGAIVLNPSSLSFPQTPLGKTAAVQFLTVANTGNVSLTLAGEALSGDFASISNTCGTTLAPQASCTVGVVFTPTVPGTRTGTLTVTDEAGTQIAPLSGEGQAAPTDLLSTPSLVFAAQQVGTVSQAQVVMVSNKGDLPLTNIGVSATGDFSIVNSCGTLLQAQGSCSISVSYVPVLTGPEIGTLTISDELRTQVVSLNGTGLAPPGITATPAHIDFGGLAIGSTSPIQAITVTNNGGITITGLSAAITTGFSVTGNDCPETLRPGEICRLGITFSPAAAGRMSGTLSLTGTNLPKALTASLTGIGEDFSLGVTGYSSAVLNSGQTTSFVFQLSGMSGTSGTVALACTGAPQNAICSLNPVSVAVSDSHTSTATITIVTGVANPSGPQQAGRSPSALLLALAFPMWWPRLDRKRRRPLLRVALIAALLLPSGCGVMASSGGSGASTGGSGGAGSPGGQQNPTPAGSYTLTVTGTMSNISHSVTVHLTVQ